MPIRFFNDAKKHNEPMITENAYIFPMPLTLAPSPIQKNCAAIKPAAQEWKARF